MGWAVIQIVEPYHPEGDPTRPETTEFTLWVFETQQDASRHKADLMLARRGEPLLVKQVNQEPWTLTNLAKQRKKSG